MALREWRRVDSTTIEFVVNTAHERGGVVSAASGQIAAYTASITASSIVPIGILLEDIEAMNFMTHPQYYQRNTSDLGSKVGILTHGSVETDMLVAAAEAHIHAGKRAYIADSGLLTIQALAGSDGVQVGTFLSTVDADGFVRVHIDL